MSWSTKHRLHITGASGSGVTTLGTALAMRLDVPLFDVDDYYWLPTDPPFAEKRPVPERLRLLEPQLLGSGWVLSGSLVGWGDPLMRFVEAIVFVYAPPDVRMARLHARETARYGSAIEPGGPMHATSQAFLKWAASYDDLGFTGRSLATHELWLKERPVPVIRVDGLMPTESQVEIVVGGILGEMSS